VKATTWGQSLEASEVSNYAFMSEQLFVYLSFRVGAAMAQGQRFIPVPTSEADLIAQRMEILMNTVLSQRDELRALERRQ
jgi:hypothetical protein